MSTSIDSDVSNRMGITRRGVVGRIGRALTIIAGLTATKAMQACGPADDAPACLTAPCRDKQPDAGGEVASEAGTGGGTDAVSAETQDADSGMDVDSKVGDVAGDAEVAAKQASLNCKPVPGAAGFKAYASVDGAPSSDYVAGSKTKAGSIVKISMLVGDGGVQCENPDKTGVELKLVNCEKIAPDLADCARYSVTSATDVAGRTTVCASSPASVQVSSALKGACGSVWKSGSQVFLAEAKVK